MHDKTLVQRCYCYIMYMLNEIKGETTTAQLSASSFYLQSIQPSSILLPTE
jgi:hypothetical protein